MPGITIGLNQENQPDSDEYINEMVKFAESRMNQPDPLGGNVNLDDDNDDEDQDDSVDDSDNNENNEEEGTKPLLAGKYKSVEDLEKGYKELEKKLGSRNSKETNKEANTTNPKDTSTENNTFTFDKYYQEYADNGNLSEESFAELEAKGYPKALVEAYIEGSNAKAELQEYKEQQTRIELLSSVGGEEAYSEMAEWARDNLSKEELKAYNATLATGDVAQIKLALKGLKAAYKEAKGSPPKGLIQGYGAAKGGDVFESWYEAQQAINDPRYGRDMAYTNKVAAKIGRSNL